MRKVTPTKIEHSSIHNFLYPREGPRAACQAEQWFAAAWNGSSDRLPVSTSTSDAFMARHGGESFDCGPLGFPAQDRSLLGAPCMEVDRGKGPPDKVDLASGWKRSGRRFEPSSSPGQARSLRSEEHNV